MTFDIDKAMSERFQKTGDGQDLSTIENLMDIQSSGNRYTPGVVPLTSDDIPVGHEDLVYLYNMFDNLGLNDTILEYMKQNEPPGSFKTVFQYPEYTLTDGAVRQMAANEDKMSKDAAHKQYAKKNPDSTRARARKKEANYYANNNEFYTPEPEEKKKMESTVKNRFEDDTGAIRPFTLSCGIDQAIADRQPTGRMSPEPMRPRDSKRHR